MAAVTVLGAGGMGSAMARRLADTSHDVTIWTRNPAHREAWDDARVAVADDPASAVRAADAVITMVTNGDAVRAVAEQMLDAMTPHAVWVQASTVGAAAADSLRDLALRHDRAMLDAPVSGSTQPARDGTLTWLVSGPRTAVERARPVLEALGNRVNVVGEQQEASRLKLVVNTWMTAATVAIADCLVACDRLGLDRTTLLDVLDGGPLGMPYALQKGGLMTSGDYTAGFPVELALKDIRLAQEAEGHTTPLVQAVEQRLARAERAGHGRDDLAAVAAVD